MPWNWNHSINFVDYDHFQVFKCCSTGTRIDTQATSFSYFFFTVCIDLSLPLIRGQVLALLKSWPFAFRQKNISLSEAGTDTFEFSSEWRCQGVTSGPQEMSLLIQLTQNLISTLDFINTKSGFHFFPWTQNLVPRFSPILH